MNLSQPVYLSDGNEARSNYQSWINTELFLQKDCLKNKDLLQFLHLRFLHLFRGLLDLRILQWSLDSSVKGTNGYISKSSTKAPLGGSCTLRHSAEARKRHRAKTLFLGQMLTLNDVNKFDLGHDSLTGVGNCPILGILDITL